MVTARAADRDPERAEVRGPLNTLHRATEKRRRGRGGHGSASVRWSLGLQQQQREVMHTHTYATCCLQ